MERIILDKYIKGKKQIWGEDPFEPFNHRILSVNNMYGWLYEQGILREVSFKFKDYSDMSYFALDAKDLEPYREQMINSGVDGAELASLDAEKTMIDVYIDHEGQKRIHYLGYFYNGEDGLKLNEYTGFDVPFSDVFGVGILDYEAQNADAFSRNQYITDYDEGLSREEEFAVINNYFDGTTPVHLTKDNQFADLPVGVYAISIYTKVQLIATQKRDLKSLESQIQNAEAEKHDEPEQGSHSDLNLEL